MFTDCLLSTEFCQNCHKKNGETSKIAKAIQICPNRNMDTGVRPLQTPRPFEVVKAMETRNIKTAKTTKSVKIAKNF